MRPFYFGAFLALKGASSDSQELLCYRRQEPSSRFPVFFRERFQYGMKSRTMPALSFKRFPHEERTTSTLSITVRQVSQHAIIHGA